MKLGAIDYSQYLIKNMDDAFRFTCAIEKQDIKPKKRLYGYNDPIITIYEPAYMHKDVVPDEYINSYVMVIIRLLWNYNGELDICYQRRHMPEKGDNYQKLLNFIGCWGEIGWNYPEEIPGRTRIFALSKWFYEHRLGINDYLLRLARHMKK